MDTDISTADTAPTGPTATTTVSLKEWGAAIHALLQGRQQILLRKGGIHERAFAAPEDDGGFLLFPTVAHTHAERTRPEHHDLLGPGDEDATDDRLVVRAGVHVVDVVEVVRPDRLPELDDLHIWTAESIRTDRVEFRPKHPLQILVVQAIELPEPIVLPRLDAYGGCKSWIDVHAEWDGSGRVVGDREELQRVSHRVRSTVG